MTQLLIANRASAVLYSFLLSNSNEVSVWLVPANICPIVPAVLIKAKAKFILVDIDPHTYCINWEHCYALAKANKETTVNLLYVHSYGYIDPDFEKNLIEWKRLFPQSLVIDDRCLTLPSVKKQHELSDLELYSTGYSKLLDIGHGGWGIAKQSFNMCWDDNYEPDKHELLLNKFREAVSEEKKVNIDYNSNWLDKKPSTLTETDLVSLIESGLAKSLEHRKTLNEIYAYYLNNFAMPEQFQLWRFNILVKNPNEVLRNIFANEHFASNHYQPVTYITGEQELPIAYSVGKQIVNLFNDHRYDTQSAIKLATIVKNSL